MVVGIGQSIIGVWLIVVFLRHPGLMLFIVFTCDLGNRTEHTLRNFIKGFKSRKVADSTAFKTD